MEFEHNIRCDADVIHYFFCVISVCFYWLFKKSFQIFLAFAHFRNDFRLYILPGATMKDTNYINTNKGNKAKNIGLATQGSKAQLQVETVAFIICCRPTNTLALN